MFLAHQKSLQKKVYSPGQWYPYFYLPPKSPEMSRYYKTVETELSRLYCSFLPKDQIHGKILDFLGVPNAGGKIKKSKLHKIFIFETSENGKMLLARQENQVEEVKLYPPKSEKLCEGPFKFFKSKNSRKLSEVASRMRGCESVRKYGFAGAHVSTPTTEMKSHSDDDSDVQSLPPSSKMKSRCLGEPSKPDPKKPMRTFQGHSKLVNSRIRGETMEADQVSGSRGNSSGKTAVKEYRTAAQVISDSSDETDMLVLRRSKIKERASINPCKKEPKPPSDKSNCPFRMKSVRNRPRKSSSFWYENTLSSDSSKSYSVESDEDFVKSISSKNKNKCSSSDQNNRAGISGAGNPKPISTVKTQNSGAAHLDHGKIATPKTFNILSSVESDDEDDLTIFTNQVLESRSAAIKRSANSSSTSASAKPPSASGEQDLNQILRARGSEGVFDKSQKKDLLGGLPYDQALETNPLDYLQTHFASSKPLLDEDTPNNDLIIINPNRKTVEFKNVEYYYYNRESAGSLTERSSSSHRSAESKATELKSGSSSDDNDYDTGFLSPVIMSQDPQSRSQDVMNQNILKDSCSESKPSEWVSEMVRPVSPLHVFPGSSGFAEERPIKSPPPDQNNYSLVPRNVQKLTCSPALSQHLSSASPLPSHLGMFPSDLELIRRVGSLKSVEEENLSQISAATEIISARIMVDLRDPGAFEAIQQHCRSIFEAVNSQNVLSTTSMAISQAKPRLMLTPPCQKENNQLVKEPTCSQQTPCTDSGTIPAGKQREAHMDEEHSQSDTDARIELGKKRSPTKTVSRSDVAEGTADLSASQRSAVPSEPGESTADEISSIISHPNVGSGTMTTPRRRKKLPFKKRWPVLSAPKLNIVGFNNLPAQDASPKESSASVSPKSSMATSFKTCTTDSVLTNVKSSSVKSLKKNQTTIVCVTALPAEIPKPSAGETTSAKSSGGPKSYQRSSVTCVELTRSMNPAPAANDVTDSVKTSRSLNSADAVNVKSSSIAPGFTHFKRSSVPSVGSTANTTTCSKDAVKMPRSMTAGGPGIKSCSSVASFKTASPMNSGAATNKSFSSVKGKYGGQPQGTRSLPAEKRNVESQLDSEELQQQRETAAVQQNRGCGSHSSKASLKEWQRQTNLVWKMTLPHISQQFFNDPETRDVRAICEDLTTHSGLTLSEPSVRAAKPPGNPELHRDTYRKVDESDEDDLEDTRDRDTTDMSCTPSPKPNLGALSPFMRDFLFDDPSNPSKSLYPNDVDPDAETQLRSRHGSNMEADPLERNYSQELESFLGTSIASCSTAEKTGKPPASSPGRSHQAPAVEDQPGPPYPVWWHREYSTPKHTFSERESASDDSMQVILPRSQVQRNAPLNSQAPPADDSFLHDYDPPARERPTARRPEVSNDTRSDVQRRTSSVRTRILKKPPTPELRHFFFRSFDRKSSCNPVSDRKVDNEEIRKEE